MKRKSRIEEQKVLWSRDALKLRIKLLKEKKTKVKKENAMLSSKLSRLKITMSKMKKAQKHFNALIKIMTDETQPIGRGLGKISWGGV